jgi:tRNA1(Val) A37 N6-methylase TrmN6
VQATAGHLLGGRVIHAQPARGHRTGIEPVLLAAAIPARAGQSVLEAGCGSGAGLLCLAARVPGLRGEGVEIDPDLATLAAANIEANGFEGLDIRAADLAGFCPGPVYDHAFANPPWHDAAGTASPDAARERAKRAEDGVFGLWAARLGAALRHRGTLTFIVAASVLPDCLAAFAQAGCGSPAILPLWPRLGVAAKLVLLRGIRGGRGPAQLLPGLVLHTADGAFTAAAETVLRGGGPIALR